MPANKQSADLRRMIELEQELAQLRQEQGHSAPAPLWVRLGDWVVGHLREPRPVSRKTYLLLALTVGWFCGAHRFYTGHTVQGVLYLLLSWTGISFAMTVVDVLLLFLKYEPDENGMVFL